MDRVTDRTNIRQVLTNAAMLEAMTGCRASYGALLYMTRRKSPASVYCVVFPLPTVESPGAAFTEAALYAARGYRGAQLYTDPDTRAIFASSNLTVDLVTEKTPSGRVRLDRLQSLPGLPALKLARLKEEFGGEAMIYTRRR